MAYTQDSATTTQSSQTSETVVDGENSLYVAEMAANTSGNAVIAAKKRKLRLRTILNRVRAFAAFMAAIGLFAQDEMVFVPMLIACLMALTVARIIGYYRTESSNIEVTGAARLYRVASGGPPGYAFVA